MKRIQFIVIAALVLWALPCNPDHAAAAPETTFVVNSTGDQADDNPGNGVCHTSIGKCTLRAAIQESNAHTGKELISFHIGTGSHTISLASQLPDVSDPTTIDGTTQPGCSTYPCIALDGSGVNLLPAGLKITAGNTIIKGLVFQNISEDGYGVALWITTRGNNTIVGNYFGTNIAGTQEESNDYNIIIYTNNNVIGTPSAGNRNLISSAFRSGLVIASGSRNRVENNYIGTDVTGTHDLRNEENGIELNNAATQNVIGGPLKGEGNIIAFNGVAGIDLDDATSPVGSAVDNSIRGNSIFSNVSFSGKAGIDLGNDGVTANDTHDVDNGENHLQNFPSLTSAVSSSKAIHGTLHSTPYTKFTLDFYSSPSCDSSGYGQGKTYLGNRTGTTGANGVVNFTFNSPISFSAGRAITATATDPNGSTSEFSHCKTST